MEKNKKDVVVYKNATLNQQEKVIIFYEPNSRIMAAFEDKPQYKTNSFITSYQINDKASKEFENTRNIGLSKLERQNHRNDEQKVQAKIERAENIENIARNTFPTNSKMGNKQLSDAKEIQQKKIDDPSFEPNTLIKPCFTM
jgi:hypothetical protein